MKRKDGEERLSSSNDIVKALAEAIVQGAQYANRDANEYSRNTIKNTKISGNQIRQNSIPGFMLQDGTVPTAKINELSVLVAQIAVAEIGAATIDFAQIDNVVITNAHIDNAGIDYANIKDLDVDSAYFGSQVFELGLGESLYMDRLRVNAANIAHLEVGELVLEDAEGNLYKIGVDESGDVVTTLYEVGYQNIADTTKELMSQYTVYRGETAPSTPYVGQLWVNTATEIISRCTAVIPDVTWEPIKANELHTSFINAVETGLEILSTGLIDVKSGGNININNGGNINVDSMGNIIFSAGGKIILDSASDIEIGGESMIHVIGGDIDISANDSITNIVGTIDGKWIGITSESLLQELEAAGTVDAITDGKIIVFLQDDEPVATDVGDLWFDTNDGNAAYFWDGTIWDAYLGATTEIILLVENNTTIFYQSTVPVSLAVGDLWYNTGTTPVTIYSAATAGANEIKVGISSMLVQTNENLTFALDSISALEDESRRLNGHITLGAMLDSDNTERVGLAIGEDLLDENGDIMQERTAIRIFSDRQTFYQNGQKVQELKDGAITGAKGNFGEVTTGAKWKQTVDANDTFAIMWVG